MSSTLDYATAGQVKVAMLDCIEETTAAFEKEAPGDAGTKESAAPDNLFKVTKTARNSSHTRLRDFTT